jgi:rare lipoprotein A
MEKSKKMSMWLLLVALVQTPLTELFGASTKKKSNVAVSSKKGEKNAPHKSPKNHSKIIKKEPSGQTTLVGKGRACIYSNDLHGSTTASGERFNKNALTAAHLNLPLGTNVRVTSLETGKSVVVRINDRGPFSKKYVLDMSPSAAQKIGLTTTQGTMNVKIEKIAPHAQEGKAVLVSHRTRS